MLLLLLIISYILNAQQRTSNIGNQQNPDPIDIASLLPIPPPNFSLSEHSLGIPIRFDITTAPQLPLDANVYQIDQGPYTKDQAVLFAQKVGITSEPFEATDAISGTMFIFTPPDATLLIYPDQHVIDFKPNVENNAQITTEFNGLTAENIARKYLVTLGFFEKESDLVLEKRENTVDETNEVGGLGDPNAVSYQFTYLVNGYKILGESYNLGTAYVQLNSKNEIVRVYVQEKPVTKIYGKYPLKDYSEIVDSIRASAIIQSVGDSSLGGLNVNARTVKEITISKIEIAYLSQTNSNAKFLQPIFHLKGTATLTNGKIVTAALYMPAIKQAVYQAQPTNQ